MAVVANWAESGLASSLKQWNGKPVLITKSGQTFAGKVNHFSPNFHLISTWFSPDFPS
jgi:hypothetical protein